MSLAESSPVGNSPDHTPAIASGFQLVRQDKEFNWLVKATKLTNLKRIIRGNFKANYQNLRIDIANYVYPQINLSDIKATLEANNWQHIQPESPEIGADFFPFAQPELATAAEKLVLKQEGLLLLAIKNPLGIQIALHLNLDFQKTQTALFVLSHMKGLNTALFAYLCSVKISRLEQKNAGHLNLRKIISEYINTTFTLARHTEMWKKQATDDFVPLAISYMQRFFADENTPTLVAATEKFDTEKDAYLISENRWQLLFDPKTRNVLIGFQSAPLIENHGQFTAAD